LQSQLCCCHELPEHRLADVLMMGPQQTWWAKLAAVTAIATTTATTAAVTAIATTTATATTATATTATSTAAIATTTAIDTIEVCFLPGRFFFGFGKPKPNKRFFFFFFRRVRRRSQWSSSPSCFLWVPWCATQERRLEIIVKKFGARLRLNQNRYGGI
jgi:hypothetical protein